MRLVDGGTNNQGRIEIYFNDTWWAICGDHFDWDAFDIVCNMFNLPDPQERYYSSEFGRGNQSILPMGFSCDERDSSLLDCLQDDHYVHYCGGDVVGVSCGELVMAGKKLIVFDRIFYLYSYLTSRSIAIIYCARTKDGDQCQTNQIFIYKTFFFSIQHGIVCRFNSYICSRKTAPAINVL